MKAEQTTRKTKGGHRMGNWITSRLDTQAFALPVGPVVQIVPMVTIAPVPYTDRAVEGIINIHGDIVPVVNLRRQLGMAMQNIKQATAQALASTQQTEQAAQNLDALAGSLNDLVEQYQL